MHNSDILLEESFAITENSKMNDLKLCGLHFKYASVGI